jgi:nucleoside 2-deoxyribosyltransferase
VKHLNYPELVHRLRILRLQVQKEDQPRCYVAGPMRGLPEYGFPAFEKAGEALRDAGWYVYSPRDNDEAAGLTAPSTGDPEAALPLKHYMAKDLAQVCKSDAVIVLPGWEESEGARLEVDVAQRVDVPVYTYLHQREISREMGAAGLLEFVATTSSATRRWAKSSTSCCTTSIARQE